MKNNVSKIYGYIVVDEEDGSTSDILDNIEDIQEYIDDYDGISSVEDLVICEVCISDQFGIETKNVVVEN